MSTLREAAQQALEALQNCANGEDDVLLTRDALAALRAALVEPCPCGDKPADQCPGEWEPKCDLGNNPKYAKRVDLAEPVQEPVAWSHINGTSDTKWHPPRKPLTEEEIDALDLPPSGTATVRDFVRIVERAHGIT